MAPRHPPNALTSLTTKLVWHRPLGHSRDPGASQRMAVQASPRRAACLSALCSLPRRLPSQRFLLLPAFALRSSIQLSKRPDDASKHVLMVRTRDVIPRPLAGKANALPAELIPQLEERLATPHESVSQDRIAEEARGLTERDRCESVMFQKGGDPTTGSPAVTLLRLHPSYQSLFRRLPH